MAHQMKALELVSLNHGFLNRFNLVSQGVETINRTWTSSNAEKIWCQYLVLLLHLIGQIRDYVGVEPECGRAEQAVDKDHRSALCTLIPSSNPHPYIENYRL